MTGRASERVGLNDRVGDSEWASAWSPVYTCHYVDTIFDAICVQSALHECFFAKHRVDWKVTTYYLKTLFFPISANLHGILSQYYTTKPRAGYAGIGFVHKIASQIACVSGPWVSRQAGNDKQGYLLLEVCFLFFEFFFGGLPRIVRVFFCFSDLGQLDGKSGDLKKKKQEKESATRNTLGMGRGEEGGEERGVKGEGWRGAGWTGEGWKWNDGGVLILLTMLPILQVSAARYVLYCTLLWSYGAEGSTWSSLSFLSFSAACSESSLARSSASLVWLISASWLFSSASCQKEVCSQICHGNTTLTYRPAHARISRVSSYLLGHFLL